MTTLKTVNKTALHPRLPRHVALPQHLEVEIGSHCNRQCAWCPNGWHDRGKPHTHMEERVWDALLNDLGRAAYGGTFAFHNYNEPLADPHLFRRIADVRARVPRARPVIYTNGDFLDRNVVLQLAATGVAETRVTRYPPNHSAAEPPDPDAIHGYLARLNLPEHEGRGGVRRKRSKLVALTWVNGMSLTVRAPNIGSYTDRAGSVGLVQLKPSRGRQSACLLPYQGAAVDHLGNLKLCCHIYDATLPDNAPYVMGNVGDTPFTTLWTGMQMERLRVQLARADFSGLDACSRCTHHMQPATETRLRRSLGLERAE
jgi:hypothetical protein